MQTQAATAPSMQDSKLHEFFLKQMQDMYWAEKKLVKTLPKLADAATSAQLKKAFNDHLGQTREHVSRLERSFDLLGEDAKAKKCLAMAGIVDEGDDIIDETDEGSAQRDVALIFAGQKTEHYEIATYGGLITLARQMGHAQVADLLVKTLHEEKEADATLTRIAESSANAKASTEKK